MITLFKNDSIPPDSQLSQKQQTFIFRSGRLISPPAQPNTASALSNLPIPASAAALHSSPYPSWRPNTVAAKSALCKCVTWFAAYLSPNIHRLYILSVIKAKKSALSSKGIPIDCDYHITKNIEYQYFVSFFC